MKITDVKVEHYDRGIPLKGWDSVENAIRLYARGITRGSSATEHNQVKAIAQSQGAFGLAIYTLGARHMQGTSSRFVEDMLSEAKSALKTNDGVHFSYDYDGEGVFFKTTVDIYVLDRKNDLYMLEISAAYVGSEPEKGLADHLGIPQALRRYSVIVQVKPVDATHFAFDFEEIVQALKGVLKINFDNSNEMARNLVKGRILEAFSEVGSTLGEEIARHFVSGDRYNTVKQRPIFQDKKIQVTVGPGRVEKRFVYSQPGIFKDTWTVKGSTLTGLLGTSYEDESKKELPTFVITIESVNKDKFDYAKPIWDADLKYKIDILSNQIAKAMKKI